MSRENMAHLACIVFAIGWLAMGNEAACAAFVAASLVITALRK